MISSLKTSSQGWKSPLPAMRQNLERGRERQAARAAFGDVEAQSCKPALSAGLDVDTCFVLQSHPAAYSDTAVGERLVPVRPCCRSITRAQVPQVLVRGPLTYPLESQRGGPSE